MRRRYLREGRSEVSNIIHSCLKGAVYADTWGSAGRGLYYISFGSFAGWPYVRVVFDFDGQIQEIEFDNKLVDIDSSPSACARDINNFAKGGLGGIAKFLASPDFNDVVEAIVDEVG